ncbi:cobyrinate a,c-diamide synthase [Vibrio ziniensis]|uniref:Cobyrinate a,c-diamide synthase n=1 Tax=Vibrio ziniensis TaxID=2711221 RepID=A0A6G7CIJ5_9VIBR|nr:cobyrinate a,c-diamide synthase [Vibrio ziniensis]QIH41868.1 cobyrinate a,c-diamide synthase [Vibrio ziniensis]
MKALLIAGTNSGSGKTTFTLGLLRALCRRELKVQPFKVGPDYIDTAWHSKVANVPSHNLDSFMLDEQTVNALFHQQTQNADIAVIEGVMGLFDGYGTDPYYCSSAGTAKALKCPVILVVDGKAMSTSAAAIVMGFQQFGKEINIAGVVFNNVNSDKHYQLLKQAVETYCHIPAFGRLPKLPNIELPSRHLGLMTAQESQDMDSQWDELADAIEQYVDVDGLLSVACSQLYQGTTQTIYQAMAGKGKGLVMAVAMDKAFNFYYQANLDLLTSCGVEIRYFSPLTDSQLPECDLVYIGGGYPELYAEQLSKNRSMLQSILAAHQANLPIYAECGGLMYLGSSLSDSEENIYPMVGILSGQSVMSNKLNRFGYCNAKANVDTLLCLSGNELRGHEFHYSDFVTDMEPAFTLSKVHEGEVLATWRGGYQVGNTLAMYLHVHFAQSPEMLLEWFKRARSL